MNAMLRAYAILHEEERKMKDVIGAVCLVMGIGAACVGLWLGFIWLAAKVVHSVFY